MCVQECSLISSLVSVGGPASPPELPTMIMDGLDTLPPHQHNFLLTESAAAAQHFSVLSFDTCLYPRFTVQESGGSPPPTLGPQGPADEAPEPTPGDLNTPVTTAADGPSFFGPSTVVEPPPITGQYPLILYLSLNVFMILPFVSGTQPS